MVAPGARVRGCPELGAQQGGRGEYSQRDEVLSQVRAGMRVCLVSCRVARGIFGG